MTAKLYGVGVGPGDSELLTLKAVKVLKEVDYICAPQSGAKKDSLALDIVKKNIDINNRIIKLNFPMTYNQNDLNHARDIASLKMKQKLNEGKNLAFITLGDPLFYSTYIYILKRLNKDNSDIKIETIPGITSISACSANNNLPLAENDENLAVISKIKNKKHLRNTMEMFENVVVLKLSRNFEKIYQILDEMNLKENAVFTSKCGQKEEFVTENIESLNTENINYLSLLITKN